MSNIKRSPKEEIDPPARPLPFDPTKKYPGKSAASSKQPVAGPPPDSPAGRLFQGQKHPKNRKKYVRLEQWVEIRIDQTGLATTSLYPSNEELIRCGQRMLPPPQIVVRRLHFADGVPAEYEWVGIESEEQRRQGGVGLQRMTVNMWLNALKEEAAAGNGHIGPVPNLPRMKDDCDCETCRTNSAILEELESKARDANQPFDLDTLVAQALAASQDSIADC